MSASGISWAICKSAPRCRQITTPAPHHSVFYRPDAFPAAQPTASKHWRLISRDTETYNWLWCLVCWNSDIFNTSVQFSVLTACLCGRVWGATWCDCIDAAVTVTDSLTYACLSLLSGCPVACGSPICTRAFQFGQKVSIRFSDLINLPLVHWYSNSRPKLGVIL